jgi:DNA processing protein
MSEQLYFQIALTMAPKVGAKTAKLLVSYCGGAEGVFHASRREILKIPGIGPAVVEGLQTPGLLQQAEAEVEWMQRNGVVGLFYTDPRYPFRLKQNADCPAMLYVRVSAMALLNANRILAVIGTRSPTDYGRSMCDEFVENMTPYGVVLVSGLAFGIDAAAHRKANSLGIPNLGVLGHGLGTIYPREHEHLARKMMENGGLISEYPHHTGPLRDHFPMRNRIIAGMADAILVVESALTGGSVITAELGNQYDRDVFAIPGRVKDLKSGGCNQLIRLHKAGMVGAAADLAEHMNWTTGDGEKTVQTSRYEELAPESLATLDRIRNKPEIDIDALFQDTTMSPGRMASILLDLEFRGLVRTLPGKRYVLG